MASSAEDSVTSEDVVNNKNNSIEKIEQDIKQELVDLTVIDDSEIGKTNETTYVKDEKVKSPSVQNDARNINDQDIPKESLKLESPEKKSQIIENDSLILTADDEIFSVVSNDKESPQKTCKSTNDYKYKRETTKHSNTKSDKNDKPKDDKKKTSTKPQTHSSESLLKNTMRSLWISNVSTYSKASDLKQFFSKHGKVNTAKIVTDGRHFYGYLSFETPDDAERSMKKLDGAIFEDKKLKLSYTRPDQEAPSETTEKRIKRCSVEQKLKTNTDQNDVSTTKFKISSKSDTKSRSPSFREKQLERDYLREKRETERLKRRMHEQEELNRLERRRQRQREEERRELEWKLEMQRKQLEIEREMFEKERKDLMRLNEVRRKIEEERLEILKEREKVKDALRKVRKSESKKRSEKPEDDDKRRKTSVKSKICDASYKKIKTDEMPRSGRYRKDSKERNDFPRAPPPPPKLSEVSKSKYRRSYEDSNKKGERDYRKIETIHRERKSNLQERKERFLSRNEQQRDGGFSQSQVWKPTYVNKPWETGQHETSGRYVEQNYQTATASFSGPRVDGGYFYNPGSADDYSRYQQYGMHFERKY